MDSEFLRGYVFALRVPLRPSLPSFHEPKHVVELRAVPGFLRHEWRGGVTGFDGDDDGCGGGSSETGSY